MEERDGGGTGGCDLLAVFSAGLLAGTVAFAWLRGPLWIRLLVVLWLAGWLWWFDKPSAKPSQARIIMVGGPEWGESAKSDRREGAVWA